VNDINLWTESWSTQRRRNTAMSQKKHNPPRLTTTWRRIPDGTKVRNRLDGHDGFIDGLTEIVVGQGRNPDGRTQYRVNIGSPLRQLAIEEDLCVLVGEDNLVIMIGQKEPYRRSVTEQLHGVLAEDRFIKTVALPRRRPIPRVPSIPTGI
jgi:hypothetical protein